MTDGSMSRLADVDSLVKDCEKKYLEIKATYNQALENESMEDLRIPVKNLMENLRSALDYMARDIYDIICKPNRLSKNLGDPRVYFPYAEKESDFNSRIRSSLPDLQNLSPPIYNHLLSIQPWKCNDNWLYDLCSILNENKHNRLVPQTKKETETYSVKKGAGSVTISRSPGVSVTSIPGSVRIMGVPAEFRGNHIVTHPTGGLKHEITRWVAFTFEGTSINILRLLQKAVPEIKSFSERLYILISSP